MIDLYNKFKEKAPTITFVPKPGGRGDYDDIRSFLNICELIAVGIKKRAFSKTVSYHYWGDVIPRSYRTAEQLINDIRNNSEEGSQHTYVDLQKLAMRWEEKSMKQLNWWRGLWRIWVIGTVPGPHGHSGKASHHA